MQGPHLQHWTYSQCPTSPKLPLLRHPPMQHNLQIEMRRYFSKSSESLIFLQLAVVCHVFQLSKAATDKCKTGLEVSQLPYQQYGMWACADSFFNSTTNLQYGNHVRVP